VDNSWDAAVPALPCQDVAMDEELARAAVAALRAAGARFAYLHGSRATGTAREGSDTDLAAWFGRTPAPSSWEVGGLPESVDLLVLDGAPLELAGRVAVHGRLLFDDDPPARVRWEATTRKIWADEAPRREQARRDFAEAFRGRP